jgi:putative ABC transport system permease protein
MLTLTLASWRQHRRRYVATFLAIFLGVGFCAATLSLTAAARQGAADTVGLQYSKADVIAYPSRGSAQGFASRVSRLPDVSAASAVETAYVEVTWPGGHATGSAAASELPQEPELRWQRLTAGSFPHGVGQMVVDESLAKAEGVDLGTRLVVGGGPTPRRVVTVVGFTEPSHGAEGVSQLFTSPGGLRAWHAAGASPTVVILGSPGVAPSQLAAQVRSLQPGSTVSTADALRQQAVAALTNQVDVMGRFLQAFAIVSLFVAGLVIANTFRIVMAQRIRDLALLRCVGAARWQVLAMSLGEVLLLGAAAAAIGTAAGIGLSLLVVDLVGVTSVDVPLSFVSPRASTLALPFAGGLIMALTAALPAVLRASRVAPLPALNLETQVSARSGSGLLQSVFGVLLGLCGVLLMIGAASSGLVLAGLAGGLLSFAGVLALGPVVVPASIRLAGKARRLLPRAWQGGVPATLSVLNATRNPRRTAATAGALVVGVTLISMMSVGAASISATESTALDRITPVDLTVSGGSISSGLVDDVRRVDGVRNVVVVHGRQVRTRLGVITIGALSPTAAAEVVRDAELRAQLTRDSVATISVAARGRVPGDGAKPFVLRSAHSSVRVKPALSNLNAGPILVAPDVLRRLGGPLKPVALFAGLNPDADPVTVAAGVRDVTAGSSGHSPLTVSGGFAKRTSYDRTISVLLLVATALLGVAVLIALVGVGNTLSLSVLERTREHGLLRALGLTTGQLRLLLANEAVLMAGSAAVLGTVLGVGYGWLGTLTLLHGATSHAPTLAVPYGRLSVIIVVAVLAGLLASVLPARRATRLSPTQALATT